MHNPAIDLPAESNSGLAEARFGLRPGRDFIEVKVAVMERNARGMIRCTRDAAGDLSIPAVQLRFGERMEDACSRLGGGNFLALIECRAASHEVLCLFERKSDGRGPEWVSPENLRHGGDLHAQVVAATLGGSIEKRAAQPWTGGESRFDQLAGIRYIGVGVGGIVINREKKVLMGLRGKAVRQEPGLWDFPGGGVELGQLTAEAVERELLEEHGLAAKPERLLEVIDHFVPAERSHWISAAYLCRTEATSVAIREENKCDGAGFFTLSEIESLPLTVCSRRHLGAIRRLLAPR